MAKLEICGRFFDIDLAIFDKDGTLVDFDRLWTGKLGRGVASLAARLNLDETISKRLMDVLGVDSVTGKVVAESPLAVTTLAKLGVVATVVLYQAGMPWHAAESAVQAWFMPVIASDPAIKDLLPIGDVPALFKVLKKNDVRIAILTSDDRSATLASLPLLGISGYVGHVVCGDASFASKPSPEGLLHLSNHFNIPVTRILMAGDSVTDMRTGRNAGVACCLGVLSGTGAAADLVAHADVIADDIHAIRLAK